MNLIADRKGNISEENSLQDCLLEKLYGNAAGRLLLNRLSLRFFRGQGGFSGLRAFPVSDSALYMQSCHRHVGLSAQGVCVFQ